MIAKLKASVQGGGGVIGHEELLVSLVELHRKLLEVKVEHEVKKEKLMSKNKKMQYQVIQLKKVVQERTTSLVSSLCPELVHTKISTH